MSEQESDGYPPRLRVLISGRPRARDSGRGRGGGEHRTRPARAARRRLAVLLFLALALLAELKPVPLEEDDLSTVSLAFVFILASVILFGWEYGVLDCDGQCVRRAARRAEADRANGVQHGRLCALGIRRGAPGFRPRSRQSDRDPVTITVVALLGGAAFVAVNFAFISLAISFHQGMPVLPLLEGGASPCRSGLCDSGVPRSVRGCAVGN